MPMRCLVLILAFTAPALLAQRHGWRSAPPTAPVVPAAPLVAVSSGLGAIQFAPANYGVPAPQTIARQLRYDDDRTRAAALADIGSPGQYLQHGRVPTPRSIDLQFLPLGNAAELDALLTAELDQHIVTAVLIPAEGGWRRIATLTFATPFEDASTTPTTWVRTARSLVKKDRYRAIFHASSGSMGGSMGDGSSGPTPGNFVENEAHLRIVNDKAVITLSFASTARECTAASRPAAAGNALPRRAGNPGCNVTQRWFQPDPAESTDHFVLITATGHMSLKESEDPLANSRTMLLAHLRTFTCQPFIFSDTTQHYEPSAPNGPCRTK
ncbi:MAG: hypothetical protein ABI147_11655 [Acidobacteriaceae bacterium]